MGYLEGCFYYITCFTITFITFITSDLFCFFYFLFFLGNTPIVYRHSFPRQKIPWPMVHGAETSFSWTPYTLHTKNLCQSLFKWPWSTNQASSSFSSPRICRPSSAKRRASARFSLVNLPCLVLASVSRARPSLVRWPVEAPPWSLQRPTGSLAGRWHKVPLRVRASHLWPCQSGP